MVEMNRIHAAAAALAALFAVAPMARADSVSTDMDDGYGRMVFTLTPAAQPKAALADGVLTLAFGRKVGVDAQGIARALPGYVGAVRVDPDGATFRFALSEPARLHTSSSGDKFDVDILPQTFAGTPPDLQPPPSKKPVAVDPATLPALKVRIGSYSKFTRLVFDWLNTVSYAVYPGAGHITLRFEAEARMDFSALTNNAPPWVKKAAWKIENNSTVVDLDTDPDAGYHDFRDGTHVVLDVLAPGGDRTAYRPPEDGGKEGPETKFARLPDAAQGVSQAQAQAIAQTAEKLNGPKPDDKAAAAPKPADTGAGAKPPQPANQTKDASADDAPTPPPDNPQSADAARTRNGAVLTFAGAGNRAVAAFIRGRTAWVVIDGAYTIDPAHLKTALGDFPDSVDATNGGGDSVLRVTLKSPEQIAARAEGKTLKIVIAPDAQESAAAIGFTRDDSDANHAALATLVPGAGQPVALVDPDAGDTLTIVPAYAGRATLQPRRYLEFSVLPTAAGLALTPFVDDLSVKVADSEVTITRAGGLGLTPAPPVQADNPAALAHGDNGPSFIDFAAWSKDKHGTFLASERTLERNIASLKPDDANPARIALARFYLANGFAAEALGLIDLAQAANPALDNDMALQTMKGAAEYMMARYRDAHNDLAASMFDGDRNAALWRGLTDAALENWSDASNELALAEPVLKRYPADWQARARLAQARAGLGTGALETADASLQHLPPNLDKPLMLEAQLERARLLAAESRYRDALPLFESVENGGDEALACRAIYDATNAGLAAGAISPDRAIATLEQLRFRWRGDALELKTLRKLGQLYFAKERWRDGLNVLRIASENFLNDDLARQAQDDMRAAFANLFLKGKADKMPPIQALALFYEFIDLTPIGPDGDEMIRRMADRLVAVDLLGPAATLLNYQVTHRLDGVAQAQVATRLAMIELMDHKAKDALAALRSTQVAGLPDDLAHQRMILQARALAALKQWDQALDMIGTDDQPDSRRLRADIYWESGNWAVAGEKAEALVTARADANAPLTADERNLVLRTAIAYSLANDQTSLNRIKSEFGGAMQASPDTSAFAVLTEDIGNEDVAFRDMAGKIASIDTLETFMKDFKTRYDQVATN